jgi:hypothetical protein
MTGNDPDRDSSRDDGDELTRTRGENAFNAVAARTSPEGDPEEEVSESRGEWAFAPGYPGALPAQLTTPDRPDVPPPPAPAPPRPAPPRPLGPDESKVRGEDVWSPAGIRLMPPAVAVPGHTSLLGGLYDRQRRGGSR